MSHIAIAFSKINIWIFFLAMPLLAVATEELAGPAFSSHTELMEMPEKWHAQPIRYDHLPPQTDLAITLDQHLYPALKPLINEYAAAHGLNISIKEGTCGISAGELIAKTVDIGGFCCPPGETDRLPGLTFHTIGIAALAILVNPDNPLSNLKIQQVRDIFQGKARSWNTVTETTFKTHKHTHIRPIGRLHCKARPSHWRLILDNEDQFSTSLIEISTIKDMMSEVSQFQEAIGYETLWNKERFSHTAKTKALRINDHAPSDIESVINGDYPFYRVYGITTWNTPVTQNPKADELVNYLLMNAHKIDKKYAIIPAIQLRNAGWFFFNDELIGTPQ